MASVKERRSAIIDMAHVTDPTYIAKYAPYVMTGNVVKGYTHLMCTRVYEKTTEPVVVFETCQGRLLVVPVEHVTLV